MTPKNTSGLSFKVTVKHKCSEVLITCMETGSSFSDNIFSNKHIIIPSNVSRPVQSVKILLTKCCHIQCDCNSQIVEELFSLGGGMQYLSGG